MEKLKKQIEFFVSTEAESKRILLRAVLDVLDNVLKCRNDHHLSLAAEELVETIEHLDRAAADLIEGAEAQVREYELQIQTCETVNPAGLESDIARIKAELERRENWAETVRSLQEGLENTRDAQAEQLQILIQSITHEVCDDLVQAKKDRTRIENDVASLEKVIEQCVTILAKNSEEIEQLNVYMRAVELVRKGLPNSLIGKPLPEPSEVGKKNTPRSIT